VRYDDSLYRRGLIIQLQCCYKMLAKDFSLILQKWFSKNKTYKVLLIQSILKLGPFFRSKVSSNSIFVQTRVSHDEQVCYPWNQGHNDVGGCFIHGVVADICFCDLKSKTKLKPVVFNLAYAATHFTAHFQWRTQKIFMGGVSQCQNFSLH